MDQISINGFSLGIMNPTDTRKKVINGANYFLMRHGSSYKLKLYNDRSTKCDAEVWIDGEKVGVWRIEAYGSTTIERPAAINRKFVFLRENSSGARSACIESGSSDNGLIKVVFKPANTDYIWSDFINPSRSCLGRNPAWNDDRFPFYSPIEQKTCAFSDDVLSNRQINNQFNNQFSNNNQQNCIQNANTNYQFASPQTNLVSPTSYTHGATALGLVPQGAGRPLSGTCQQSKQEFNTITPIRDIDTANITTIMARLIVDDNPENKPLVSLRSALHGTKYPERLNARPSPSKLIIFN